MGNYSTSAIQLNSNQKEIIVSLAIHRNDPLHQLDPAFRNSFSITETPSFIDSIEPTEGVLTLEDEGSQGRINFQVNLKPNEAIPAEWQIKLSTHTLVLPTAEMVGTPATLRNNITIPFQINDSIEPSNPKTLLLVCRFN